MVNTLASRVAGFKLASIILAFVIPLAVLSYFINTEFSENRQFVNRELMGTRLMQLTLPVLLDAAAGKDDPAAKEALFLEGPALAQGIGTGSDFIKLERLIRTNPKDHRLQWEELNAFIRTVGTQSNLLLDPHAEINFLAATLIERLPDTISGLVNLLNDLRVVAATGGLQSPQFLALYETAGSLRKSLNLANDTISTAAAASADHESYTDSLGLLFKIVVKNKAHIDQLRGAGTSNGVQFYQESIAFAANSREVIQTTRMLSKTLLGRLENALSVQIDQIETSNWIVRGLSAGAILIGLGTAVHMFRSTLRRLDELEITKFSSDTARRDAEDMNVRLMTINEDVVRLNQELADKMRRLKEAQDELLKRGRLEQLGQLTATVAHELRNPLGAVRTSAFLLERKLKDKNLGVEPQLQRINNGILRCDGIITQLLDFSRTKQISAMPADLDDWLAKIVEEEARRLPSTIAIDCMLGLDGVDVPFDTARLQRGIINLMSNAAEAMIGNGEDVTKYATPNPKLTITTEVVGDFAVISVTDNGPGIPPEILAKIREPLFTTKSFGTGLGIPAVEQIAAQHGGRLDIASELGRGASFSLYLPLVSQKEEAA